MGRVCGYTCVICTCMLCHSHAVVVSHVTALCSKHCRLKDRDVNYFAVLTEEGGKIKDANRKEMIPHSISAELPTTLYAIFIPPFETRDMLPVFGKDTLLLRRSVN